MVSDRALFNLGRGLVELYLFNSDKERFQFSNPPDPSDFGQSRVWNSWVGVGRTKDGNQARDGWM